MHKKFLLYFSVLSLLLFSSLSAQEIKLDVKEHTLKNGLKVLLLERHNAPVVSTVIRFRVGSVDEHPGITGSAHLLEHMLFKGSQQFGTSNYEAEVALMKEIDKVAHEWTAEMKKIKNPPYAGDQKKAEALREKLRELQGKQKEYVIKDELWETYLKNGGSGLNASTSEDGTQYFVSLPSNKLEVWAMLESDRMASPVLREFYSERDVVFEERRLRTDTQPMGKLYEQFAATAFTAHPYNWPVVGWASDISTVLREDVEEFFRIHYAPNNAIIAIVGDINPDETIKLIEKYFASIPSQTPPPPVFTEEPEQKGERRIQVEFDANPQMLIGYHMPAAAHPDQYVLDVIASVLSRGRTSRLYKSLVEEKKLCASINASSYASRYPDLFTVSTIPLAPHTTSEVEKAVYEELEKLKKEPVTDWELERTRNQLEADFIRTLNSNMGLAFQLSNWQAVTGDWKFILTLKEKRKAVTREDIIKVAQKYFIPSNRTVATLVRPEKSSLTKPVAAKEKSKKEKKTKQTSKESY